MGQLTDVIWLFQFWVIAFFKVLIFAYINFWVSKY